MSNTILWFSMLVASLESIFLEILIIFTSKMLLPHPHVLVEITYIDVKKKNKIMIKNVSS